MLLAKEPLSLPHLIIAQCLPFGSSDEIIGTRAVPIDNGVEGEPSVHCDGEGIRIQFRTLNPFRGRIFAKGKSDVVDCSLQLRGYEETYSPHFYAPFDHCDMNRLRMLNPRGLAYSLTIIISFHPVFITKVDRAYKISCFYGEATREVSVSLNVSMLPTTDLTSLPIMPTCMYSVRKGSPDGPPVQYAKVGDPVYHRWECDSHFYGFLVKECFVYGENRARDTPVEVLDTKGCATDPVLLSNVNYDSRISLAWAESHVFKFADALHTHFQCKIQICLRQDGACDPVTPPRDCTLPRLSRPVRSPLEESKRRDDEMDVADAFLVLDLLDEPNPTSEYEEFSSFGQEEFSCPISTPSFITLIVLLGLTWLAVVAIVILLCKRRLKSSLW